MTVVSAAGDRPEARDGRRFELVLVFGYDAHPLVNRKPRIRDTFALAGAAYNSSIATGTPFSPVTSAGPTFDRAASLLRNGLATSVTNVAFDVHRASTLVARRLSLALADGDRILAVNGQVTAPARGFVAHAGGLPARGTLSPLVTTGTESLVGDVQERFAAGRAPGLAQ
jgi:hypothetical protein